MARLPRISLPGIPLHIIQRGNNRQVCFGSDEDFATYARWLGDYAEKFSVAIHAWVFMTNHVHLLLTPQTEEGVSRLMQALGRHYVRYFNYIYKRTGTLWEGRFKSCVVQADNYLLICQRYIELNPVRAGMVQAPGDYKWSSFRANGCGQPAKLWTPHDLYRRLGKTQTERTAAYRELFRGHLDLKMLTQIRQAANQGLALGSDRFKQEIERLAGRRVVALKKGRKRKRVEREPSEFLL
jgi:putative transposase